MTMTEQPRPARPRPRLRTLQVRRIDRSAPRIVTVTLGGADLEGFDNPGPGRHMKVFFPPEGEKVPMLPVAGPEGPIFPPDQPRPVSRTYTPRRWRPEALELDFEIVLHDGGLGSGWARRAEVGDTLVMAGPGGRYRLDPDDGPYLLMADHAGLPALGSILEILPGTAHVTAFCQVPDVADECGLPTKASVHMTWLHARGDDEHPSQPLVDAVKAAKLDGIAAGRAWIGCESGAMHTLRPYLLNDLGMERSRVHTQGYWKVGVANHPDHDYGDED